MNNFYQMRVGGYIAYFNNKDRAIEVACKVAGLLGKIFIDFNISHPQAGLFYMRELKPGSSPYIEVTEYEQPVEGLAKIIADVRVGHTSKNYYTIEKSRLMHELYHVFDTDD